MLPYDERSMSTAASKASAKGGRLAVTALHSLPDLENRNEGHVIHPVTLAVYGLVCEQPCLRETLDKPEGSSALEALGPLPSSGSPQNSLVPTFRLPTPWIDAGSCPVHWIASVTETPPNNQALGSSK